MNRSVAERVTDVFAELSPAQRQVARFLRDQAGLLGFFSAAQIAQRLGTSDATVVRTAQALGYRGLAELKQALADEARRAPEPTPDGRVAATLERGGDPDQVLAHALDVAEASIAVARQRLRDSFPDAVTLLAPAERIVLSGTGPSAAVANYAALLLSRIGRPAATVTGTGVSVADEAMTLARGDALVLLAYTRLHEHAAVLLRHARRRRVPVVLLTDELTDVEGVDAVLTCPRGVPGQSSSHGLSLVVVEALVLALAAADRPRADRALRELNQLRAELLGARTDVDRAGEAGSA